MTTINVFSMTFFYIAEIFIEYIIRYYIEKKRNYDVTIGHRQCLFNTLHLFSIGYKCEVHCNKSTNVKLPK